MTRMPQDTGVLRQLRLAKIAMIFFMIVPGGFAQSNRFVPEEECKEVASLEVHYNEFFELYLGHNGTHEELQEGGIIYKSLREAMNECCPGIPLNFKLVNESVEYLVQRDILLHHEAQKQQNTSHELVFYFPEFTSQGNLEVYSHQIPFLKLRKSPGFALIMLKSESHLDISALDVIGPSWPIFALLLSLAWAVGILGWVLDHRYNPEEFPTPFIRGMFEGFWWSMVTMTTVGYGDKAPKSFLARILCIIWILAGAVLLSLFTANTTSIITASRFEKNAQTMGKKIGVVNMKQFVEAELNLGAQLIEYTKVEEALKALNNKSIDRLLFPHYLDLLYIMSDPNFHVPMLTDIYIAREFDKPYQIGMVLSHGEYSSIKNNRFYTCLEIMTSRANNKHDYDYSLIDGSIIDDKKDTFDTKITLHYLYGILGVIGFMLIIGVAIDVYNLSYKPTGETKKRESAEHAQELARPV
ncbi:uncharacterized protein LOC114518459 [Dendronephthya gigantea]|uniref:uncharacterized protein LOC114518459 n=1 Tax=Dendronephthya gigantea TaxID=151771 RepID=UPI001069E9E3|nr:uncharacterized protein LOC114518459 [Dendronephthya gigantea]XP_028394248.1 uncharacterized protein LOC114518459 [Dendronephthya gigantea]